MCWCFGLLGTSRRSFNFTKHSVHWDDNWGSCASMYKTQLFLFKIAFGSIIFNVIILERAQVRVQMSFWRFQLLSDSNQSVNFLIQGYHVVSVDVGVFQLGVPRSKVRSEVAILCCWASMNKLYEWLGPYLILIRRGHVIVFILWALANAAIFTWQYFVPRENMSQLERYTRYFFFSVPNLINRT